ncbi:MAG: CARDB domain-containing protein [Phycisphaerae bacterium]|jgi:hypothetical protein
MNWRHTQAIEPLEGREMLVGDLTVSLASLGATLARGTQYGAMVNVANIGDDLGSETRARVQLYLTRDATFRPSTAAALAGASTTFLGSFAAGSSQSDMIAFTLPETMPGGTWRLFAWVDPSQAVPDRNRNNNVSGGVSFTVTGPGGEPIPEPPKVDLRAAVTMLSPSLVINEPVRLRVSVQNTGPDAVATGGTFAQIYRTRNATPNPATDQLAGDPVIIASLGAGATVSQEISLTLPEADSSGVWRFYAVVDGSNQTVELNEDNNVSTVVTGTYNLGVRDIAGAFVSTTLPSEFVVGQKFSRSPSVKFSYRNAGDFKLSGSVSMSIRVALRPIAAVNASTDIQLASPRNESVSGLAAGASRTRDMNLSIPANVPVGAYRLIVSLDDRNAIFEVNEANNLLEAPSMVTVRPQTFDPAITASTVDFPAAIKAGASGRVSLVFSNLGNTTFKNRITLQFYFLDAEGNEAFATSVSRSVELRTDRVLRWDRISVKTPAAPGAYSMGVRLVLPDGVADLSPFNNIRDLRAVNVVA